MKRRIISLLLSLALLLCSLTAVASAVDDSRSYNFDLSVGGEHELRAATGQILTVTLLLSRTDCQEVAQMYGMQTEICYDDSFFRLVDNSVMTASGVEWRDMARRTGGRVFYLNFVSFTGGALWEPEVLVGSFQLEVIGTQGVSSLSPENSLVSIHDGSDCYVSVDNAVTVIVTTDCTVHFEPNGGTPVADQTVQYGQTLREPETPTREGYVLTGWYSDLDCTRRWDFAKDTVKGNMTLYAGWTAGSPDADDGGQNADNWMLIGGLLLGLALLLLLLLGKRRIRFETNGGTPLEPVYVRRGAVIGEMMTPVKPGAVFDGWFRDPACTQPWQLTEDTVRASMTLYARWRT